MENREFALDIQHLTVNYVVEDEVVEAVTDVSLSLEHKKTLGLVGETGAGKTSTALAVLRLIPDPPGIIKSGKVYINGRDIYAASSKELETIRGKEVSMIFQDPMTVLNPVFTIGEQLAEAIDIHEHCGRKAAMERAKQMLEMVGISGERAKDYPHQFSGGMKQRVVIAIALACNPKLLIADEPTTALDVTIQAQVLELMKRLKKDYGTSLIMITHDLGIVAEVCDDVAIMYAGRIVEQGSVEEIFDHTLHPYTEGLFNSLPNIDDRNAKLIPIPGLMPNPADLPAGCAFAPRCSYATAKCQSEKPELRCMGDTHKVACHRYEEEGFKLKRSGKGV